MSSLAVTGRERLGRAALAATLLTSAAPAAAQPFTGYELALQGATELRAGREARLRGVAYRVRGLAELVPFAGRVRVRVARSDDDATSRWVEARSATDGRFLVDAPVPLRLDDEHPRLEVEVGPDAEARRFELPVTVVPAIAPYLRTDRELYQAGEPVHVWLLLSDVATGRPLPTQAVELSIHGAAVPALSRASTTNDAGVAHLELAIPPGSPEGPVRVTAAVPGQGSWSTSFRVGTRTWERLLATIEADPELVAPGEPTEVTVRVTTPGGAPIRDAEVILSLHGEAVASARTGPDGVVAVTVTAPAHLEHETGRRTIRAEVRHPAHGSVTAFGELRLAVPLALGIEIAPPHGGLVPEIESAFWIRLVDGAGDPPPVGTEVVVEGPAVRGGRASGTSDVHGVVEIPALVPLGAASAHLGRPETSVLVRVLGALERTARLSVPVLREADVAVTLERAVLEPGHPLEARVARRPRVARAEVVVELLDGAGAPIEVAHLPPGQRVARLSAPPDRLGVLSVRARAVLAGESLEGAGTVARFVVRPARPDFITVTPERPRWVVGETARVTVSSGPGAGGHLALLVRDLAAHGGERPFERRFLADAFDRAVLDPSTPEADRLVRAALSAHALVDDEPSRAPPLVDALGVPPEDALEPPAAGRGTLRDPWPEARELSRRGVAAAMNAIEERLRAALDAGGLGDVTVWEGGRRGFRDDLLGGIDDPPLSLGGAPITPAMLTAADASFHYDAVARRVARARLVTLMLALTAYLDPGDDASPAARMAAREPSARWLPRMVERGILPATALDDPWGRRFELRRSRTPRVVLSAHAIGLELASAGPDGRFGNADDVRDPFARAVPRATPYALASGEDALMRRLAVLSPLDATLRAIAEAYRRVSVEMSEEEIGDAVSAEVSEGTIGLGNIGTIGHGGGGGSGSGYGRGAGSLRGRAARAPRIRVGRAAVSGLASVVRERFPPTLLFQPSIPLDPSGRTTLSIPLADTVSTFLVEVIAWRPDGWVWSDTTRIEVDRELVVSAPVPEVAHAGDRLRLPLRVSNRGDAPRDVVLRLLGDPALGLADSAPHPVTVAAGDAAVVHVEIAPERVGRGHLTALATTPSGGAIDAVRLPVRVLASARRQERVRDGLAASSATVEVEVPPGADPREASVEVVIGGALFAPEELDSQWVAWAPPPAGVVSDVRRGPRDAGDPVQHAFGIGATWGVEAVADSRLSRDAVRLTRLLDRTLHRVDGATRDAGADAGRRLQVEAFALLGLSPATRGRTREVPEVLELVRRLRGDVAAHAVELVDDPERWVVAAAALGWSAPPDEAGERVAELVRRLERDMVAVGDDRWLATARHSVRSTLLLGMAELSLGRRQRAFERLSTVGRWAALGHRLAPDERGLARALVGRLLDGVPPDVAELVVDAEAQELHLTDGVARVEAPALGRPGRHAVTVTVGRGAPVFVRATTRYGLPWTSRPAERGPFALAIEGDVGPLDGVSGLSLLVRNRTPRTLPRPIVEIELPTGAELAAHDRAAMATRGVSVDRGGGVLRVTLPPLPPGAERRVPLPLRWSVDGRLRGLGVAAWAADRPEAVSVLRPRVIAPSPPTPQDDR